MSDGDATIPNDALRERLVQWHDPSVASMAAEQLSGLEIMRRIRDGTHPAPPMAQLIGFQCVVAEPGEVAMRLAYDPSLENGMGILHGGAAASILDTAMGAAAHTMLPLGSGIVTLNLGLTYLHPIFRNDAPVTATGRVLNLGRRNVYVAGEVVNKDGTLLVHAVGSFSILRSRTDSSLAPA